MKPNNYKSFERKLSNYLSKFPYIKEQLKKLYQHINYLFFRKNYKFKTEFSIHRFYCNNEESFWGYYDKSPINETNEFLIFHSTDLQTKNKPNCKNPIKIILYDYINKKIIRKFISNSYNWQQGAKLQWIDNNRFIFNDYDHKKGKYISRIINTKDIEIEQIIDFPIYDVFNNFSFTLNFDRLNILRPDYGYRNSNKQVNIYDYKNDGIFFIDLDKNTNKLIIPIEKIINLHYKTNMESSKHWFNHIMISPNGEKFIFLHRWLKGSRKYDALIASDIDGEKVKCLADDDMVSHCFWIGSNEVISFMRDKKQGDKYYKINVNSGEKRILGKGIINKYGDGHPSIFKEKMLFDTYPNKSRMKELFIYNLKSKNLTKLGDFFESFKYYNETRCDLHPRWSYDGKKVFFDSVHSGKRFMYMLKFK